MSIYYYGHGKNRTDSGEYNTYHFRPNGDIILAKHSFPVIVIVSKYSVEYTIDMSFSNWLKYFNNIQKT